MKHRALLLIASAFFASAALSASAEPLTVLTYNLGLFRVFGYDFVPRVEIRARAAPAELARFAGDNTPDVILLEEVWRDRYADAISGALAPRGYAAVRPKVHSILGLGSGLLLLVKQPMKVVEWKFTPFAKTTFTDSFARKGVLEATIETASGLRFVLLGTHTVALDTDDGTPTNKAQVNAITSQAAQILGALAARSQKGSLPAIIMGDFNVGPGYVDEVYESIADSGSLRETGDALFPGAPLVTWDPGNPLVKYGTYPNEPSAKIDQIFLQNGIGMQWNPLDARVVETDPVEGLTILPAKGGAPVPTPLSDHYGFLARIELKPAE
jgi:endonuclease/exonuclease/phosphatase family metal-dependent hydrolase